MDCAYFMPTILKARRFLGYIRCLFHLQDFARFIHRSGPFVDALRFFSRSARATFGIAARIALSSVNVDCLSLSQGRLSLAGQKVVQRRRGVMQHRSIAVLARKYACKAYLSRQIRFEDISYRK
jgi:hypothetical protein